MKTNKLGIALAGSLLVALAHGPALAQQTYITSLQRNGQLTWTNVPATNGFAVQWAPTASGPWSSNWLALDSLISTNPQTSAAVPMVYRVAQGFSLASMRGTWILGDATNSPHGVLFFTAQDDGIVSESAAFIPRAPAGYFTVAPNGRVTNTLVATDSSITFAGTFAGPNQILLDSPNTPYPVCRVEDPSRCAGNWTGTLSQTNGPGMPATYSMNFSVDPRGLVGNFRMTNLTGTSIGRLFALTNGVAVGFFFTGSYDDNGPYNQIKVSGTLTGNGFAGSYYTDSGSGSDAVLGTAVLTRQ